MNIDYILHNRQDHPYIERFISIFKEYNWSMDCNPSKDKVLFICGNNSNNIDIIRKVINQYHTIILFVGKTILYYSKCDVILDVILDYINGKYKKCFW
jgi:hypothetical protein